MSDIRPPTATRRACWPTRSSTRFRRGERPSVEEYAAQYPELADEIRELFPALVMMEQEKSVAGRRAGTRRTGRARSGDRPRGSSATTGSSARSAGAAWGSSTRPCRSRWAATWR